MSTIQEVCSLEELVLQKFAKKLWINSIWQDPKFKLKSSSAFTFLFKYVKFIKKSPLTFVPKLLRNKLIIAAMELTIGYEEAIAWQNKLSFNSNFPSLRISIFCQNLLPFSVVYPDAGQYEASNFITPLGHFEDLRWTKLFVVDTEQPMMCRFILACVYCFEEMISGLWHEMKSNNLLPSRGNLTNIKEKFGDYIALWAYRLENEIDEDEVLTNGFYVVGFNRAVLHRHEYAARFFFEHCSAEEKNDLVLSKLKHYATNIPGDNIRIINFLYSLLSVEQKNEFIAWAVGKAAGQMFGSMLCTHFGETILKDIMTFSPPIPTKFLDRVLSSMTYSTRDWRIFICSAMFQKLWKKLSEERRDDLLRTSQIFHFLTFIDDINLFETVIIPLPLSVKREMLLKNWQGTSKSLFLVIWRDYDTFLSYLVLYFLQYNDADHTLTLRVDAFDFLDSIINCEWYVSWLLPFDVSYVHIIHRLMQHFRETLPVIHQLVTEIGRETTDRALNYHGVLSTKIYPILSVKERYANDLIPDIVVL